MTDTQDINSSGRQSGRRANDRVVGASNGTKAAVDRATAAARSDRPVLVVGPTGSGRGHLARAIHAWSSRSSHPLVVFSSAATPEEQHERELFGADPASSPLADGGHAGALERAGEGSVLIQAVDQLSSSSRSALARCIKEASFNSGGSNPPTTLHARVIVTSESDGVLSDIDLHRIEISGLSQRREDVLPLAAHFLAEFSARDGSQPVGFTADARRWLVEEPWPGNVRELSERIRQAVRLAGDGAISAEALMLSTEGEEVPSFKEAKRAFETRYVEGLLRRCNGNISRAARLAKKDLKDFYDVIRRTGVDPAQFRH